MFRPDISTNNTLISRVRDFNNRIGHYVVLVFYDAWNGVFFGVFTELMLINGSNTAERRESCVLWWCV
jgi:hypothetical protein